MLHSRNNFFTIALLSIFITFIFSWLFYRQGIEVLLPQNSIWFWTIVFTFLISSFWYKHTSVIAEDSAKRVENYTKTKLAEFQKKYTKNLANLSDCQKKVLLAILIVENYNRPKFIRVFERLLSFVGLAKTTGLAQISQRGLSDYDSVCLLKEKIQSEYQVNDFDLEKVREFVRNYNGNNYDDMVLAVLQNLDSRFVER